MFPRQPHAQKRSNTTCLSSPLWSSCDNLRGLFELCFRPGVSRAHACDMRDRHTTCPGSSLLHKETKPGFAVPHFAYIVTMQRIRAVMFLALVVATGANLLRAAASHNQTNQKAACTLTHKSHGSASWKGRCHTLDSCRGSCTGGCVAFNWWPNKGGCRHYTSVSSSSETEWTTVGGAPDCTLAMVGPTNCAVCSGCQQPAPAWCTTGIKNPTNRPHVCCASTCGTCGGSGCAQRTGGKLKCCHSWITSTCTAATQTGCVVPSR